MRIKSYRFIFIDYFPELPEHHIIRLYCLEMPVSVLHFYSLALFPQKPVH